MLDTPLRRPDGPARHGTAAGPSALDPPVARRLRRPSWRDPRLLVGVVLVLASTVAGALVVRSAGHTVAVYEARRTLTPGERLTPDSLKVTYVRVPGVLQRYLAAGRALEGSVVLRTVPAGELVALSAVGQAGEVDLRPVTVPVDEQGAASLDAGALVDVWVASRSAERAEGYDRPRQVAAAAQVAARTTSRGPLGSSTSASVRLLLSPDLVPFVIEAVDNGARITLVPVPVGLRGSGT